MSRRSDKIALQASYRAVFDNPDGERVLRHLMDKSCVDKPVFVQGDPYATAFNDGSRTIVLSIIRFLEKDFKELIKQMEEDRSDA